MDASFLGEFEIVPENVLLKLNTNINLLTESEPFLFEKR
jgi:hypothetical protein